jgi:hypothetical protein
MHQTLYVATNLRRQQLALGFNVVAKPVIMALSRKTKALRAFNAQKLKMPM